MAIICVLAIAGCRTTTGLTSPLALKCCRLTGAAGKFSQFFEKNPMICSACRSTVTTRSTPTPSIMPATSAAEMVVCGRSLRSCRA